MRVVIDNTTLVTFVIRPNFDFERMFDHIVAHGITMMSEDIVAELFDAVPRKIPKVCATRSNHRLYRMVRWNFGTDRCRGECCRCGDPGDDKFRSLADCGKADCIIV